MDFHTSLGLGLPFALGLAAAGCGVGMGRAVYGAMEALGRQPEASGKILLYLTIGCAFIESLVIYVLVFVFMYGSKIVG